jgi:hypothetical protein
VTNSFAVLALVGWGASFYSQPEDQDFDSVIGQLELKWYLAPVATADPMKITSVMSSIAVGFVRDFDDGFIGSYLERDQGYVRFSYLFASQFLLVAEVRAGAVVFPNQTAPDYGNPDGWTDARVDGTLFGEWRVKDWLGINAEYAYTGYFSNTELAFNGGTDRLGYQDHRAFLGLRVFW